MKKLVLSIFFLIILSNPANSEVIILKNGNEVEGKILNRTDSFIEVDLNLSFPITYYLDEIQTIDGKTPFAPPPQKIPVIKSKPLAKQVPRETIKPPKIIPSDTPQVATPPPAPISSPTTVTKTDEEKFKELQKKYEKYGEKSTAEITRTFSLVALMLMLAYLSFAVPLFVIGKKTETSYYYLALLPIAQFYLMCKIAGRPVWWTILFFVPIISITISVILWMEIAEKRNKPKWMGILTLVPIIGMIVPFYFAFAD